MGIHRRSEVRRQATRDPLGTVTQLLDDAEALAETARILRGFVTAVADALEVYQAAADRTRARPSLFAQAFACAVRTALDRLPDNTDD